MSSELSINSVTANPANVNPQVKAEQATAAPQINQNAQQSVEQAKTDTVTVSAEALQMASKTATATTLKGAALAKSLKLAGQTVAQIALKMGLDAKTVNGYLGVSTKAATTALPLPTTVAPQAKQAATDLAATAQTPSPAEEVKEPAAQKATEALQAKK